MKITKREWLKSSAAALTMLAAGCSTTGKTKKANNVVLISIDDLNAWIIDPMRHPLSKTPHIDALLSRSMRFTNAHCAAPVCAASRTAFMTGVAPHDSGVYTNAQSVSTGDRKGDAHQAISDVEHVTRLFKNKGYQTLGAGKIYHKWVTDDDNASHHYDHFMPMPAIPEDIVQYGRGYPATKFYPFPKENPIHDTLGYKRGVSLVAGPVDRKDMFNGYMPDELITQWCTHALKSLTTDAPFYMAVGYLRPHVPFTAPQKYFDAIPLSSIELPEVDDMKDIPLYGKAMTLGLIPDGDHKAVLELGEDYWKSLIQGYLASIAFIDDQIGELMGTLQRLGLDETTDVILLSDHGQNMGEKANWRKMCLWEESTRVPFAIRPAGGLDNAPFCDRAVSLLDLYPTLCAMHDLPTHHRMAGNNLVPLLMQPQQPWDKPVLVAWHYQNFAVRSNRWRLIRYRDNTMELYDHQTDPLERTNLIDDPQYQSIVEAHLAYIPQNPALPYGSSQWQGDKLDAYIQQWKNSSVPAWLGG